MAQACSASKVIVAPAADELEPQIHGRLLGGEVVVVLVIAARLKRICGWCLHQHGTKMSI